MITWLHLSDLHLCGPRTGWDADRILQSLLQDLQRMETDHGLAPDLLLVTGDLAFGHFGEGDLSLQSQFDDAALFLQEVQAAFSAPIPTKRVFLVPGNHDLDRCRVRESQTDWLDNLTNKPDPAKFVNEMLRDASGEWSGLVERLAVYKQFLQEHYPHLLQDEKRLCYAHTLDIHGHRLGIAGLNSAWSCGRDKEKGKLWLGGQWQFNTLSGKLKNADLKLALAHHPLDWLVEQETPNLNPQLEQAFHFFLHGHEHFSWVAETPRHIRLAAGACYGETPPESGYSFVRLDLEQGAGQVWLRRFDDTGLGWIPRVVSGKTNNDGLWPLEPGWLAPKQSQGGFANPAVLAYGEREVSSVDIEKFREEVQARLEEIDDPRLSVAFALRVALATLPILAEKAGENGFMWYWKEADRERYLFAICHALQMVWLLPTDSSLISNVSVSVANAASAARTTAYATAETINFYDDAYAYAGYVADSSIAYSDSSATAIYAAAYVADTVAYATHVTGDTAAYATRATYSAYAAYTTAIHANDSLVDWIRRELNRLNQTSVLDVYWNSAILFPPISLQKKFLFHLRQLPTFDYWADWLQERYDGKPLDPEILKKSVLLPKEIAAQNPRSINRYLKELTTGKQEASPVDIEKFRKEVKARLKEIGNRELYTAFAWRMALTVLPTLNDQARDKGFLWYWKENKREENLFGICRSQQFGSVLYDDGVTITISVHGPSASHAAAETSYTAYAARAAADATQAAVRATFNDEHIALDAAADAAFNAALAVHTDDDTGDLSILVAFVWQELKRLNKFRVATAYLIDSPSLPFPEQRERFLMHLRKIPSFDYWADWFRDRFEGKPWDPEVMRKSLHLPNRVLDQSPRAINRYLKKLANGENNHRPNARRLLAQGDYDSARATLLKIPSTDRETWQQIKTEFGFVFDFSLDKEADVARRKKLMGQIDWRRKLFAILGTNLVSEALSGKAKAQDNDESEDDAREEDAGIGDQDSAETESRPQENLSSERKGEKLEQDTLRLLRRIFEFDEEAELEKLRQQRRGNQFGFDVKLEVCFAANNKNVRCCVECKSHEKELPFESIVAKLLDAEANQPEIDHWILIAPRARLIGNVPDNLVERWNAEQKWPFTVQFWMTDTEVGSLFGLAPDIYDDWIDHPAGADHPKNWSLEKRKEIRQKWLAKLRPPPRLPKAWVEYVNDPDKNGIFMENDDRDDLKALREEQRYIPPGVLDESGSSLSGGLEKIVRDWLREGPRIGIVLGEFGDGKSAFTYMLSRALLAEFRDNPAEGWLPVRFPLRYFARPNTSAREFIRNRLEELGSDIREWNQAIVGKRRPLVILDGMDEMTKSLTQDAVGQVIKLLVDCCNHELERVPKILITCRRTFFEELAQRRYVTDKLKGPSIFHIEPFSKAQVYEKLEALAEPEQRPRLHALKHMHDPIGLARKALFFKMVSQTLIKKDADFSSETGIYRGYVEDCLGRKADYLEGDGQDLLGDDLIKGMLAVMEWIAREMHLSDQDYVCLERLADGDKGAFAELLWQGAAEDEEKGTDAIHRVGVRSLLSRATGKVDDQDKDAWPVEFCHRSVREYFVARGLEQALRSGLEQAKKVIEQVDINHEVLRFTAELMRAGTEKEGHDYDEVLQDLTNLSRTDAPKKLSEDKRNRRRRLGSTAVTLLFQWSGKLEAQDWSRMILDGARLAGADLTGKNFYGTSLCYANLNNAVLDGADLRFADLTGVRLEEAGEMTALSAPHSPDHFFVAYRDGSIRRWPLGDRSDTHPEVVFQFSDASGNKPNSPLAIAALPGSGLCVWDRDSVWFLDAEGDGYREVSRFSMDSQHLAVSVAEDGAVLLNGGEDGRRTIGVFDFAPEALPSVRFLSPDSCVRCVTLGELAVLGVLADGNIVVHAWNDGRQEDVTAVGKTLGNIPGLTCLAAQRIEDSPRAFRVAWGNKAGVVGVWQCNLDESGAYESHETLFEKGVHEVAVKTLCFVDEDNLLAGWANGMIYRFDPRDGKDRRDKGTPFELKLRCRNAKVAGLKGERERKLLEKAEASVA